MRGVTPSRGAQGRRGKTLEKQSALSAADTSEPYPVRGGGCLASIFPSLPLYKTLQNLTSPRRGPSRRTVREAAWPSPVPVAGKCESTASHEAFEVFHKVSIHPCAPCNPWLNFLAWLEGV